MLTKITHHDGPRSKTREQVVREGLSNRSKAVFRKPNGTILIVTNQSDLHPLDQLSATCFFVSGSELCVRHLKIMPFEDMLLWLIREDAEPVDLELVTTPSPE